MAVIQRRARVAYSPSEMLQLVNDIESYPEFLHWCHAARIEKRSGAAVEAALDIGIGGIYRTMRTRNTTDPGGDGRPAAIHIEMLSGPVQELRGTWTFAEREPGGCDIELRLEYQMHRGPFGRLLRTLFDEIANSQLNAFIRRADRLFRDD